MYSVQATIQFPDTGCTLVKNFISHKQDVEDIVVEIEEQFRCTVLSLTFVLPDGILQ